MRVECARCGHAEDDTYDFDLPLAKKQPMEAYEPAPQGESTVAVDQPVQ
jgi:hypothetical protein